MAEKKIALITEGISEQNVIKYVLQHYISEEPLINIAQPLTVNGKQQGPGGWHEVLKYCENEGDLVERMKHNDYLVIQIDTDMCETKPYSVSRRDGAGNQLTEEQLWQAVVDKLKSKLPKSIDESRIIFAISTETIECWLLPICCVTETDKKHKNNCLSVLNSNLKRKGMRKISVGDKNSDSSRRAYSEILKMMRKKKDIKSVASYHYGFKKFIEQLEQIA